MPLFILKSMILLQFFAILLQNEICNKLFCGFVIKKGVICKKINIT
jgi:hypothetical protein